MQPPLNARAMLLADLRSYFSDHGVLEVETPALSFAATPDPQIQSLSTLCLAAEIGNEEILYLHTSPEFPMKRLLADGSGSIYQICKVFRDGESGRYHNPEFTLLEWYRPGWDHHQLMDEVESLLTRVLPEKCYQETTERLTYEEVFSRYADIDHVHEVSTEDVVARTEELGIADGLDFDTLDRDGWLDLVFSYIIAPNLGRCCLSFIYDYPVSQAALAKINPGPPAVAERFEVFVDGIELANGFHELTDTDEQRRRFAADNKKRRSLDLPQMPIDEHFLEALEHGLPPCAGVALGVDRLLMLITGAGHIDEVLAFPFKDA